MLNFYITITLFLISLNCQAIKLTGTVINASNDAPIPYVNIGIQKKTIGVISNERGEFILNMPDSLIKESLTISCIGFKTLSIPIESLKSVFKNVRIVMNPDVLELGEVQIKAPLLRDKKLGITAHNPFLWGSVVSKNTGDIIEVARIIRIKNKMTKILSAHIYLNAGLTDSGTFRLNFYYLKDGKPDLLAVNKSIIRSLDLRKGWLEIDVSKEDIRLNRDFAFSFEYLPHGKEHHKKSELMYGGKLAGSDSYFRLSSQGEWQKAQGAAYTMFLKVRQ